MTPLTKAFITLRPAGFDAASEQPPCPIEEIPVAPHNGGSVEILEVTPLASDRPELDSAAIVVAGGRGLGSKEGFSRLEQLADRLHAAIGASRVAVDMGWAPHELQIGQTGRKIAPDLYMAFGVSGAAQHVAGVRDARLVVAVNRDADAPLFRLCDYGLVADAAEALPRLINLLAERSSTGPKS